MIEFLKTNISWIKEIFWVLFTLIATIIGILTYFKAKDTILQPVRTEVIKRQTEIFVQILDFINSYEMNKNDTDGGFDYINIANVNFRMILSEHGFQISEEEQIYVNEQREGAAYTLYNSDILNEPLLFSSLENVDKEKTIEQQQLKIQKKRELAKTGVIEIDYLCKTKKNYEFTRKIYEFSSNPFMPKRIQDVFTKILVESNANIDNHMAVALKEIMIMYYEKKPNIIIDPYAIYNQFCKTCFVHDSDFNTLRTEVRKYLKIDKMP